MPSRSSRTRQLGTALVVSIMIGACSGETASTTTATSPGTTSATAPTSTTSLATSTTTSTAGETVTVLLAPFSEMGPGWTEQVFPYGEGEEFLGTSPGGDDGSIEWGPEYGTQTPDGTWWFLDAANLRIAHFAGNGTYIDQVVMPEDLLVDGQYFQYQMPQAFDDGSIAAGGFRSENTTALLRVVDGEASGATFDGAVPWVTTDGQLLYGLAEDGAPRRLDPANPVIEPVDWLIARDGSRYRISVNEDEVVVELPDAATPLTRILQMRYSEDPEVAARAGIEVETGADGTIFIIMYGVPESDETLEIGSYLSIAPDGMVSEAQPITSPFSMADPGSPSHLGVTPGTSTPWIMVVDEDGVHIFTLTG